MQNLSRDRASFERPRGSDVASSPSSPSLVLQTFSNLQAGIRPSRPRRSLRELACRALQRSARAMANSHVFTGVTTVLTVYALFGDDIRLAGTEKPADYVFDCITVVSMSIFSLEILVCTIGKVGYLFGFFFWLDIMSTITLLLDITSIAEEIFGDSISRSLADSSGGGGGSGSDSAEAGRAARMSRIGTKAGRVVRLIRLVRLMRFVKTYRKGSHDSNYGIGPGFDAEDDLSGGVEKESAVSKKLSEMTTHRVVMLVLLIMLCLPFFQPAMWKDKMPSSAQYGINVLYRRFVTDMGRYRPWGNATARAAYLQSRARQIYVDNFYAYVYYHNPLCGDSVPAGSISPQDTLARLFWVGKGGNLTASDDFFLPGSHDLGESSLNDRWEGRDWFYYQCKLTSEGVAALQTPWHQTRACLSNTIHGVPLVTPADRHLGCPEDLRYQERTVLTPTKITGEEWEDMFFFIVFDRRQGSRMEAMLNTAQTLFICFLLGFGAMTFSRDANKLVLTPIERMITKLNRIRNNPLEAMAIGDEEHQKEQVSSASMRKRHGLHDGDDAASMVAKLTSQQTVMEKLRRWMLTAMCVTQNKGPKHVPEPMETVVLEKTIIKIGSLLALGFGEAGAEIIGLNMQGGDSAALNAMIPGRRVEAIFGFCDIRNFTDATEVLQDQVMVFVNRIANVVHSCVHEFFGSPNKNIGDAFLLAWRLSGHCRRKQQRLADLALVSFVKVIAQINKSPLLAEYRNHPKLVKRLPNYRVRMGFGMHSGWAIEGAIGSEFKIDASYLSPNVNMAARLEAVTKQFGCLILLTEALHRLMSESIADECRLIDHVKLVGTKEAFKLYTLDLDDLALEVDHQAAPVQLSKQAVFKARLERQRLKASRWSEEFNVFRYFGADLDIRVMRHKFTDEFYCRFSMAYLNYEAGEWQVAKDMLEATRFLLATEDGPSAALLRYMRQYDWKAPKTWPGFRMLAEK